MDIAREDNLCPSRLLMFGVACDHVVGYAFIGYDDERHFLLLNGGGHVGLETVHRFNVNLGAGSDLLLRDGGPGTPEAESDSEQCCA